MDCIYLDNAATSWPKPPEMVRAMTEFQEKIGASPGRSGHRLSIEAGRIVLDARVALAELFNASSPLEIVFTKNATEALNISVLGLLRSGDHVITSGMEHNSVMRPLKFMQTMGVEISTIQCSERGELDPDDVRPMIRKNTRAIFLTHASNVSGSVLPVAHVGGIARENDLLFCVDAAQSAGAVPIDVGTMNVDLLAFTGHKSLFGPAGTGGLYVRRGIEGEINPIMMGGTGSRSEFEEQPDFMPDKFESGTPNTIGIAGMLAGTRFILERGVKAIETRERALALSFIEGVSRFEDVVVYGPSFHEERIPVVSFNIRGVSPSDAALFFDERYGIMTRPGLHCAPSAHRTMGTFPGGTNRMSFGYFNTERDVITAIEAVEQLCKLKR